MGTLATSPRANIILLVILAAFCAQTSHCEDQLQDVNEDKLRELGQRLVRRNFLRFGKRSSNTKGPGEHPDMVIMGKHPHKPNTRSFLRFGRSGNDPSLPDRRADNFLRFGKSYGIYKLPVDPGFYVPVGFQDSDRKPGGYRTKALRLIDGLICKYINKDSEDDSGEESDVDVRCGVDDYVKKSNDFLRFGKK